MKRPRLTVAHRRALELGLEYLLEERAKLTVVIEYLRERLGEAA